MKSLVEWISVDLKQSPTGKPGHNDPLQHQRPVVRVQRGGIHGARGTGDTPQRLWYSVLN